MATALGCTALEAKGDNKNKITAPWFGTSKAHLIYLSCEIDVNPRFVEEKPEAQRTQIASMLREIALEAWFNPRSLNSKTPLIPLYNSAHLCKHHIFIRWLFLGACLWARQRKMKKQQSQALGRYLWTKTINCHNKNVSIKITLSDFLLSSSKHLILNLYLRTLRFIFQAPTSAQNSK